MELYRFIEDNNVKYSDNLVDEKFITEMEKVLDLKVGPELRKYILKFGYLQYKSLDLYAVTAYGLLNSSMIVQTLYVHKYFPSTVGLVVIEDCDEADYILVNGKDEVFEYIAEIGELTPLNKTMFDYILEHFEEVKED